MEVEKKFRFGEVTIAKSIKTKKTEELIVGDQEAEKLWNVLSPFYKDRSVQ